MTTIKRVPHCSHWGAYTILVEDGRIVGVEPFEHDPAPSPIIHSIAEWANPERRVLRPMVRSGWLDKRGKSDRRGRGREKFVPVSWDEATTLVADEVRRVAGTFGNASIFAGSYGWTNSGRLHHASSLLKRMLNLVGGFTRHVDTYSIAAGPVILRHTLGNDDACGGRANTLDTIVQHTETLVVFGALSPRTAQNEAGGIGSHRLETYLRQIVERGVKVIHVSPLKDDLPDWVDAEWWPIRPNTDTALMLGLAGEIVKAGRHDADFLARCTSGADRLLGYLEGKTDGVRKDAAWAASICGLDADRIATLASRLVDTRSMLTVSWSLQRAHHGEQPFWAALGLASVVGQIGLPGGGVGYGYASLGGVGAPLNMGRSPAISQLTRPIDSFIPVARISDMLLNPGRPFSYEGEIRTYPDTRLVYWAGGNPYHHHQDLNRLSEAWTRPETIIVQDPMFTATAQRADIVLPATTSIERNDLAGNRRSDFILAMKKAIEPLGESRSDFAIFDAIAGKLGVADRFNEGRDEMGWVRHLYEACRSDAAQRFGFEMPDFDAFWEAGYARCPVKTDHTYLTDFRNKPEEHALKTESGKIVLGSETLARLDYADCRPHPAWIEPAEWLGNATAGQMHLVSHQPAGRLHSQLETGASSRAMKRNGREQARLHPDDAAGLGVEDGRTIRIWNSRGECLATAEVTDKVRQGVLVLPTGAWFTPTGNSGLEVAGNPNVLTLDIGTSQFGQGCSAHTCLVRVEHYAADRRDAFEAYRETLVALAAV
ncbi:Asp-tRNA(Asn)/Glu-tRNA(Gln) amidotransferase GatCAB subunit C [Bradyrhizobium sp. WBOS7]|uniref:Asp-tRNA(Asn)/Glu-tRNA(Gln) amidotransferase GatCAB subunit C n=1 Tax=Bradyrhizobium betae TaxID=244734 RepID=A0AAE9NCN7_9BRAD|nr:MULTISPECIES: molybdopterin-dependent oxidoreductase [Bradyrhizobium]MDD1573399.1 Asp-tRNA(Asn)/Glu-tRNA(Gln) amidotransferase GatCAB subunit C [Bradyrhizobium sp. WBOS1]UUO38390.1 Asp-tRNA(Asn)/Glu-tRNA(Gln) amidotransferase GatCAB subunit C [Bradyrhizobium sp. WBOS01]MDD1530374.1 Asp-tRNA(Asn)/Glu-tRNA(Gln) amidotransferase GatCAB subunit C [Bradyrhizobium sp. WBOS2]MDD1579534.1 Asp-tRNA(Asn)/Glu-tRNA(Gln) amidotransferase GatCAB subunit C [Bradyrhizobium sp. WBOS7]MDD1603065.1 Asp-tRNA(A